MGFSDYLESLTRKPVWLVKLYLDQCANDFGEIPCAATGDWACYYTYPTCKDTPNFTKSTYIWKFTNRDSLLPGALPLLERVTYIPIEIDAKYNIQRRGEMVIDLVDDKPLPYANPGKTLSNPEASGTLWKNLLARNPNYYHRIAEVYLGFEGLEEGDFRLFFRGVIEKLDYKKSGISISVKDLLKNLDRDSHLKASDGCKVQTEYSGGSTLKCFKANELPEWGIIKSADGKYVAFNGKENPDEFGVWTLNNCEFIFGSSGAIAVDTKIKQVLVYARDNSAIDEGFSVDWIMLDLICNRGQISADYIKVVDNGATLSAGIDDEDTTIPVSDGALFPDQGVVKIDDELVIYTGKDGDNLLLDDGDPVWLFYGHQRGAFGTIASAHLETAKIYLPQITKESADWLLGTRFRAEVAEPKKVQELLNQICEQALVQVWQNENSELSFRAIAPPEPGLEIPELDDEKNILEGSLSVVNDPNLQASRVVIYYAPNSPDPGNTPDKYSSAYILVDEDIENENWLNDYKEKTFYGSWIYRETEAGALASRFLMRYREGVSQIQLQSELKDWELQVGDWLWVKSKGILDETGEIKRVFCQVLKKQLRSPGKLELSALEIKFEGGAGGGPGGYAYIGPENPTLKTGIDDDDTTIELQLSAASYQEEDFRDTGQIRIEDEKINYDSKSYNPETKVLTLSDCERGALSTTPASHSEGVDVLLLFAGSEDGSRLNYSWLSDADNKLDSDGDGVGDTDGYYIY